MSGRAPNVRADGAFSVDVLTDELSGCAAWEVQMSRWNFAPLIVSYPQDETGEVVSFAPPGASLNGEADLDLAVWRRGTWDAEWAFTAGRPPLAVEEIGVVDASADLPSDFYRWGLRETAAHVERLRAFTRHRERRHDLVLAADRLEDELRAIEPDALERHCLQSSMEAARSQLLERRRRTPAESVSLKSMGWHGRVGLAAQFLLLLSLYGAYRLARPDAPVRDGGLALAQLPFQSVPELLMWGYGYGHVVISFGVLGWLFFRRHTSFDLVRNAVLLAAALTVVPYLALSSSVAYGRDVTEVVPASALPTMPAMHLAVALVLGCSTAIVSRSPVMRLLWVGYPLLTAAILVASRPSDLFFAIVGGTAAAAAAMLLASAVYRGDRPRLPVAGVLPECQGLERERAPQ
jgi:hypothetical protein